MENKRKEEEMRKSIPINIVLIEKAQISNKILQSLKNTIEVLKWEEVPKRGKRDSLPKRGRRLFKQP